MAHRMPQCVRHTNKLLEELERDREFDVLRHYLIEFHLFPRNRDTSTAPIRYEELKELVKHWKLHSQRNFWRNHTKKEDLVRTLHKHINSKILPNEQRQKKDSVLPQPPKGSATSPRGSSPRGKMSKNRARKKTTNLFKYKGDLFGTRGTYEGGMIYLSRLGRAEDAMVMAQENNEKNVVKKVEIIEDEFDENDISDDELEKGSGKNIREKELKRRCACSLYTLTVSNGNERAIVEEGCMPAIVRLCMYDDMDTKRYCSGAIVNLTCDLSLISRLMDEGVLTALSELSKAQQEDIRRNTATALCRTSYERIGQLRLVQEGGLSSMLNLLTSPDYETREACVKALINISSFSGSGVSETVVQTLVTVAMNNPNDKTEDEQLQRRIFVSSAIRNLSLLAGARVKVIDDGLLDAVVALSRASEKETDVFEDLAVALHNFSGLHANLESMADVRVLDSLKILLNSKSALVQEMCAISISNLSCNSLALDNLVTDGMIPQLLRFDTGSPNVSESVSQCLSNMASIPTNRPLLSKEGAVPVLLKLLNEGNISTKQCSVIALCNLMMHPSSRSDVITFGIVPCLVSLADSNDLEIREICALALFNLSCDESLQHLIINGPAITALIALSQPTQKPVKTTKPLRGRRSATAKTAYQLSITQQYCLGALYNLSFQPGSRMTLSEGRVLPMLCTLFDKDDGSRNEVYMQQCAVILCNLSFELEARSCIVQDGAVDLIHTLMKANGKDTSFYCSVALCNIAIEAVQTNKVLCMLIKLSNTPHKDITLNCAMAFSKLTSNVALRGVLVHSQEFAPTLTFMMRCGLEDIQINAAVALCNLACEAGKEKQVWKSGTVPDFIVNSLLRVNSNFTKEICARALFNLLTHPKSRTLLITQGVLYALVKLARLDSTEIRFLCVTALYNLSVEEDMIETLMEMNVVTVITKMCMSDNSHQEIRRLLSACLTNVAWDTDRAEKLTQDGGLDAVQLIAEFEDTVALRNCATILSCLSYCQPCCIQLAQSAPLMSLLVKFVSSTDSAQSLFALNATCNISRFHELHDKIIGIGLIRNVFTLLVQEETADDAKLVCTKIVCNIVFDKKNFTKLLHNDIIRSLHIMLSKKSVTTYTVSVCSRIIEALCEDDSLGTVLNQSGTARVLSMCADRGDEETITRCLLAACRLSRSDESQNYLIQEGVLGIIEKALVPEVCHETSTIAARHCSTALRNLSTYKTAQRSISTEPRIIHLVARMVKIKDRQTSLNCAILLYNLITNAQNLKELEEQGAASVLIDLSQDGPVDTRQICAVALTHLNTEMTDSRAGRRGSFVPENAKVDPMKGGLVSTLVSMLDMDQSTIQKVEQTATTLAVKIQRQNVQPFEFLAGEQGRTSEVEVVVDWTAKSAPHDEQRYSPTEPQSDITLNSVSAKATAQLKDETYGLFRTLKATGQKHTVRKGAETTLLTARQASRLALEIDKVESVETTPSSTQEETREPSEVNDDKESLSSSHGRKRRSVSTRRKSPVIVLRKASGASGNRRKSSH